ARFDERGASSRSAFETFCRHHAPWLDDFALFCAIKHAHGGRSWWRWPRDLRLRRPDALSLARAELGDEIRFHQFVQYQFDRQWESLKKHCQSRGVGLIGDIPIFVAHDS